MRLIGVDCDLRRIHAWDEQVGRVCYRSPDIALLMRHIDDNVRPPFTVLYEIASATDYTDDAGSAVRYNKRRWMLWNMATAPRLDHEVSIRGGTMLVSSSQSWTRGYSELERREICHPDASNHDLRECQAMIYFHRHYPPAWISLSQYLARL